MSASVRLVLPFVAILLLVPVLSADNPFVKKSGPPNLKDLEANVGNHLGNRTTVQAWLLPSSKPSGTGIELTVQADAKASASRIRFLAPKSLAEPVAALKDGRRVRIVGTVLAAESVRAGYTFEVEEIAVLDDKDAIVATLKATAGPLPTPEPEKTEAAVPVPEKTAAKPTEGGKKGGGVSTLLVVGASFMAMLLGVLGIVGVRLVRKMNANPPPRRKQPAQHVSTETVTD